MLNENKLRYSVLFKAIAIALVCLFVITDMGWGLAVNSRLKPFSEKNGLDFQTAATAAYVAKELKGLVKSHELRDSHIERFNRQFPNGSVEIERDIRTAVFQSSNREYQYAVFHLKKDKHEIIHVLFVDNLTEPERAELGIKDDEKDLLNSPGLEGVWFVKPKAIAASEGDAGRRAAIRLIQSSKTSWIGFTDMAKANLKNSLYSRQAVNALIAKNVSIVEEELAKAGINGVAFKISGDEVGFVLPGTLSKAQVMDILVGLQKTLEEKLSVFVGSIGIGSSTFYAPYMPVGCVLVENKGEDAETILENGMKNAEIAQRMAKEKKDGFVDLVRVHEKYVVHPRSDTETVSAVMTSYSGMIKAAREDLRKGTERLEGTYEMEDIYPAFKRRQLWEMVNKAKTQNGPGVYLIRGPPDTFYVVRAYAEGKVQVIEIQNEYRPYNEEMKGKFDTVLKNSERITDTRGDYSFKCAQDSFDHSFGNDIIMLENLGIYEAFKSGTSVLTEQEIAAALGKVENFVNAYLGKYGFGIVAYAATVSTDDVFNGSKTIMPIVERMCEAKRTTKQTKVITCEFYNENRFKINNEIIMLRARLREYAESRLKEEHEVLARSFARLSAVLKQKEETLRIHGENLKYTEVIPKNTILCHIITDSILPLNQRPMLQKLEKNMAGSGYSEKVVRLKVSDPANFMEELRNLIAAKIKEYEGYNVRFDVACPGTEYVNAVLNSDLGIKALAFQPCNESEVGVAQVEAIILALRAMQLDAKTDGIEALKEAYKFLMGKDLTAEELSGLKTLNDFLRRITFTLPVTKVDYNNIEKLNRLIRENIESAA